VRGKCWYLYEVIILRDELTDGQTEPQTSPRLHDAPADCNRAEGGQTYE